MKNTPYHNLYKTTDTGLKKKAFTWYPAQWNYDPKNLTRSGGFVAWPQKKEEQRNERTCMESTR
jgi:hypothetical protein